MTSSSKSTISTFVFWGSSLHKETFLPHISFPLGRPLFNFESVSLLNQCLVIYPIVTTWNESIPTVFYDGHNVVFPVIYDTSLDIGGYTKTSQYIKQRCPALHYYLFCSYWTPQFHAKYALEFDLSYMQHSPYHNRCWSWIPVRVSNAFSTVWTKIPPPIKSSSPCPEVKHPETYDIAISTNHFRIYLISRDGFDDFHSLTCQVRWCRQSIAARNIIMWQLEK